MNFDFEISRVDCISYISDIFRAPSKEIFDDHSEFSHHIYSAVR